MHFVGRTEPMSLRCEAFSKDDLSSRLSLDLVTERRPPGRLRIFLNEFYLTS